MRHDDKRAIALWRLSVLGPLVSARLEYGDRRRYFEEAARRTHERPDGRRVRLSARTVEAWYSADPLVMRSDQVPTGHGGESVMWDSA